MKVTVVMTTPELQEDNTTKYPVHRRVSLNSAISFVLQIVCFVSQSLWIYSHWSILLTQQHLEAAVFATAGTSDVQDHLPRVPPPHPRTESRARCTRSPSTTMLDWVELMCCMLSQRRVVRSGSRNWRRRWACARSCRSRTRCLRQRR